MTFSIKCWRSNIGNAAWVHTRSVGPIQGRLSLTDAIKSHLDWFFCPPRNVQSSREFFSGDLDQFFAQRHRKHINNSDRSHEGFRARPSRRVTTYLPPSRDETRVSHAYSTAEKKSRLKRSETAIRHCSGSFLLFAFDRNAARRSFEIVHCVTAEKIVRAPKTSPIKSVAPNEHSKGRDSTSAIFHVWPRLCRIWLIASLRD